MYMISSWKQKVLVDMPDSFPLSCPLVDGKWSSWVSWGACSVSCGGGTRQRTRLCASPAPLHGGRQCEGNDVHIDFCNSDPCPSESTPQGPGPQ